ncbi:MAG: rod shape-determining protein RodA [Candidatus Latescibacteria bacterium]|nr:rod shape-determining protein RodA [Candidatus Latescibacterota bacterium]
MRKPMAERFDRPLLVITLLLSLMGVVMLYSAAHNEAVQGVPRSLLQVGWLAIGWVVLYCVAVVPTRVLHALSIPFYFIIIALLIAVLATDAVKGSSRWLRLGPFGLQPSELAKVAVILVLARYLDGQRRSTNRLLLLLPPCLFVGLPIALIIKQPDLGTSLVFGALLIGMLYWNGISVLELLLILSPIANVLINVLSGFNWLIWTGFMLSLFLILYLSRTPLLASLIVLLGHVGVGITTEPLWNSLHDYQRQRVETFVNPYEDALGAGYQIIQSKIAIGSGGLFGKGLLKGTQTQLSFLPEQHTDFIFSVVGEELGFVGAIVVLGLFFLLVTRGIRIASEVKGRYHSLIAAGCVSVFAFHVIVNVGMTTGLFPVVGVPLPFLSYGGSSLLTNMTLVGLLLNVWRRRHEY